MSKESQLQMDIRNGIVDPSFLGKCAHKIEDFQIIGLKLFCKTPRFDWHRATKREKAIVRGYGFTCI